MSLVRVWNKVLLMGDENVGKSSIMLRFSDDQFFEGLIPTIGIDFKNKVVQFPQHSMEMVYRVWDTAGLPQFRSLLSSYLLGSNLVVIVFDVTNRQSFESVRNFHHPLAQTCTNAIIALVANKIDLMKSRVVSTQEAQDLATDLTISRFQQWKIIIWFKKCLKIWGLSFGLFEKLLKGISKKKERLFVQSRELTYY